MREYRDLTNAFFILDGLLKAEPENLTVLHARNYIGEQALEIYLKWICSVSARPAPPRS